MARNSMARAPLHHDMQVLATSVNVHFLKEYPEDRFLNIQLKKMLLPEMFALWATHTSFKGAAPAAAHCHRPCALHIFSSIQGAADAFQYDGILKDDGVAVKVDGGRKYFRSFGPSDEGDNQQFIESFLSGSPTQKHNCVG